MGSPARRQAPQTPGARLRVRAYAKINLVLEVVGKRADGYHEVLTILQAVGLYDELTCEPAADLTLEAPALPDDAPNLVLRAAEALQEATGCQAGAALTLRKHIPTASGLGGGSADAAATLTVLNRLWNLYLERVELERIAAQLGSDVPFYFTGGTALARGRGERVEPLPDARPRWLVILVPDVVLPDKTRQIYATLDPKWYTPGGFVLTLAQRLRTDPAASWRPLGNGLEPTAMQVFPGPTAARDSLVRATEQAWREFPRPRGRRHRARLEPVRRRPGALHLLRQPPGGGALPGAGPGERLHGAGRVHAQSRRIAGSPGARHPRPDRVLALTLLPSESLPRAAESRSPAGAAALRSSTSVRLAYTPDLEPALDVRALGRLGIAAAPLPLAAMAAGSVGRGRAGTIPSPVYLVSTAALAAAGRTLTAAVRRWARGEGPGKSPPGLRPRRRRGRWHVLAAARLCGRTPRVRTPRHLPRCCAPPRKPPGCAAKSRGGASARGGPAAPWSNARRS